MSWGRFDTRTIVLIPIAIAINIVLGQTVSAALKVPIYLDSIGTILVGVLAGPIPGLVTGLLANLIWTYVLPAPFHSDYAAPFAVVAAEIGFVSGVFAQFGFFRSRPNASGQQLRHRPPWSSSSSCWRAGGLLRSCRFYTGGRSTFFGDPDGDRSVFFQLLGWLIAIGIVGGDRRASSPCCSCAATRSRLRRRRPGS